MMMMMMIDELASNKTWVWLQQGNQHSSYQENDIFRAISCSLPIVFPVWEVC